MKPDYLNESLPVEERAKDLVSRMTLEEKASQLRYNAPAVEHLGIPFYNWWNEALHGVARAGVATVFPQPIGLAAAFDDALVQKIGDAVSTEGRAKYNEQCKSDDRGLYKGITFWSPNVNIFRDPRWGRGHETYGEDPYLTSRLGVAYVKGLQGEGERLKAVACPKHYAAHSGPEKGRHSFNSKVSQKDLRETYLPAFEACVKEAKAESIMGGYNLINGEPACGSKTMITGVLRGEWGFKGHFVSDCGAIKDFHMNHHITHTAVESAAMALKNGCDLNCGNVYLHVLEAYQDGLIDEHDIDVAVTRLMTSRIRLGMFDENCPFDAIPYEANDTKENHLLSLEAARRTMVLLKNNGVLPLDKNKIKTIAVIGPNADSREILKGNYNGTASEYVTILSGIRSAVDENTKVYYSEGSHLYRDNVESLAEPDDRIGEAVSMAKRSDVVILCLGLDATIEGEEGDANNNHAGADKDSLDLPQAQQRLLERVVQVGKPTILLLSSGSALAVNYAQEHCDAVMQLWYPGQMGGQAAADLLFGKCSPSAKLPVTFYKTTEELPDFTDYSMSRRTYRYMREEPLYPFGYGLSYADFCCANLRVVSANKAVTEDIRIAIDVTNKSAFAAEDVVEVYVKVEGSANAVRNQSLAAFRRIALQAGETKTIELTISADRFKVVNESGEKVLEGIGCSLFAGLSQPDERSVCLTGKRPLSLTFSI